MLVDLKLAKRLGLVVMALFPALWGLLGGLNNLTDFTGTANNAVKPLIAMTNTYQNPLQTWRAITAPWAAPLGLALITTMETAAGIVSLVGLVVMLANIRAGAADFAKGKAWMILGCL
jgi:predicted small integral membrane protein